MKSEERTEGDCEICDHPRFQLSNGIWVCEMFYPSPMHMCAPVMWEHYQERGEKFHGYYSAEECLQAYAGCSVEQYLKEVRQYLES